MAPCGRPPRYHDRFNAAFPYANALPFVSLSRPPQYLDSDHSPAAAKLLFEHCVNTTTHSIGFLTLENW